MGTPTTLLLALSAFVVGPSVGLPTTLDTALRVLADTDLELKGFYKALETHDFSKAGALYDKIQTNVKKLEKEASGLSNVKVKQGLHTERFMRLAEVQIKMLVEKMGAIINNEKEDEAVVKNPKEGAEKEKETKKLDKDIKKEEKNKNKKKKGSEEDDEVVAPAEGRRRLNRKLFNF